VVGIFQDDCAGSNRRPGGVDAIRRAMVADIQIIQKTVLQKLADNGGNVPADVLD
jgi:hypothetical protein